MLLSTLSLQPIQAPFGNPNQTGLKLSAEQMKRVCEIDLLFVLRDICPPPPLTIVVSPGDIVITEKPPKHCVEFPEDCYFVSSRFPPQPHCLSCPIIDLSSLKDNESIIITPPPGGQVVLSKILNENISGRLQQNYTNSTLLTSHTQ